MTVAVTVGLFVVGTIEESWSLLTIGYIGLIIAMVGFGKLTMKKR